MKWRNGLIGIELMAAISLSAFYGVDNLRVRSNRFGYAEPCERYAGCPKHRIAVRMPKFGRALAATAASGALLVPFAALTGRVGRVGIVATLLAAGSLTTAVRLRNDFLAFDQPRRDADNAKADMVVLRLADDEDDFLEDADCRDDDRHPGWATAA